MSDDKKTYEIGYGRPPERSRFKKGQSGNPKGRPRGVKNTEDLILDLLKKKMVMNVSGEATQISAHKAILMAQLKRALDKGDTKAGKLLLDLHSAAEARKYRTEAILRHLVDSLYEVFLQKAEKDPEAAMRQLEQILPEARRELRKLGIEVEPLRYESTLQPDISDYLPVLIKMDTDD